MSKEIQQIIEKLKTLAEDEKAVLATVIDVRGSSYRLPGAKMLITENGDTFGTVSGGCLEADVMERAKKVLQTGEASVFTYDTTKDENSVFSLNMGCRGVIRILLEPISAQSKFREFLETMWLENNSNIIIATVISAADEFSRKIGSKLMCVPPFIFQSDFDVTFQEKILATAEAIYTNEKSRFETIDGTEIFFEFISSPIYLFIFGAGSDAIPLSIIAKNLGWRVFVSDYRPAFAVKDRFPTADSVTIMRSDELGGFTPGKGNYVAVVMYHNYENDKEIICRLLNTNVRYIGALGPKRRTDNILQELKERGETFSDEQLKKLHAPVGLDIGADTPEAIALSIVAEIQAVLGGRTGGYLRERKGSIYGRGE